MTFGEKLRRARREKGLTQAELANQAGLGLRTIIAYEKGETYPQKRSTYQTLADILGVQADDLHNEETTASAPRCPAPSGRTASGGTRSCCRTVPPGRAIHPMKNTAKKWRNRPMRTPRAIPINRPDQSCRNHDPPGPGEGLSDAIAICKDRYQFDATRAGVDKSHVPTFESRLETLTQSLVGWIAAGQCFLMETNGRPGAWFVLQLPAPDDYPSANKRKGGAKATACTPLPRATMWGPYTSPRFAGASKYMLTFCKACCPRLAIEVPLDNPLSRFRLTYWLDQGFVPNARVATGGAVFLVLHN